jgi:hypothetical protein
MVQTPITRNYKNIQLDDERRGEATTRNTVGGSKGVDPKSLDAHITALERIRDGPDGEKSFAGQNRNLLKGITCCRDEMDLKIPKSSSLESPNR